MPLHLPMFLLAIILAAATLTATQSSYAGPTTRPATLTETPNTLVLDNGLIRLTVDKSNAQITSILSRVDGTERQLGGHPRESFYWDCNTEPLVKLPGQRGANDKGYSRLSPFHGVKIIHNTPDRVEIAATGGPGDWLMFQVETRLVLFANDPGWYSYVVFNKPAGSPGGRLWQTRFVTKFKGAEFDTHFAGSNRIVPRPTAAVVEKVMDATYKLADGTYDTKYNNSVYWAASPVYGTAGKHLGLWSITASPEYFNGGPVKQGQTVHDTTLLRTLTSVHFGAAPVDIPAEESWTKIYGPFYTYINTGPDAAAMHQDAIQRQQKEAAAWPYAWVDHPAYIKDRGSLTASFSLPQGAKRPGAWAILAAPGGDWPLQGKAYQFFTFAQPNTPFTIHNIIPGSYTLYLFGADEPEQYQQANITIAANQTTDLGTIHWPPTRHGQTLWQIGTFDRSAAEYRNGEDARHYQVFRRYQQQFPDDITFTIGSSIESRDWSHAHWTWFNKTPEWKVLFTAPNQIPTGTATLTIAIAAAQPLKADLTQLQVNLNGQPLHTIALPKTGTAGYRGGVQDSKYNVITIPFPTSLLTPGQNTLTLSHTNATPFPPADTDVEFSVGHVMYDALRLELP